MAGVFEQFAGAVDKPVPLLGEQQAEFWRKDPPVIEEVGNERRVKVGGMFPHQRQWWDLPNFIKVLIGGYGAGKTSLLAKRAISLALQNTMVPIATVSPTFPLARQTIIPTIQAYLSGKQTLYGRQMWFRYNKSTHEFRIRFKGRIGHIICYSGEDPDSLRGPNLGAALIDEPFIQQLAVFDQMIARVRHPDAVVREIGLGGTPEQLNWGYDLVSGELRDRYDLVGSSVGHVQASSRANLALDATYVKRLEGSLTGKAAEAYIEGKLVQLSKGLVYYGFQGIGSVNVDTLPIPPGAELGCGMDFNVNPFAFVVFWRAGSHMHIIAEYELENADTEYACAVLREQYVDEDSDRKVVPKGMVLRTIYPDATADSRHTSSPGGKTDYYYIKKAGFNIDAPTSNPNPRDRENAVSRESLGIHRISGI
jgi:hypothetical protein